MYFFNIYNLRHIRILWNFTCTVFETVFVLLLYCVLILLLCCVLSCILYFETCFMSTCCLTVFLFMKWTCIYVCIGLHVKYLLFLSDLNVTWILLTNFRKMLIYKISWKSVQLEPSCSMQTDGQTDVMRPTVTFHNVCIYQVLCAML